VCAKALALNPADRYQRAEDLAEDVRRWIVDEPISIFRDPWPVRAARWARRHRTAVATASALLLASLVALSAGLYFVNQERARTETQRKLAVANASQALRLMRLAQDSADTLLAEVADVDLAEIPQMEIVRKRLLERARGNYEKLIADKGDDPLVQWGSGRSLVRLGDIEALLGEGKAAEVSYTKAIEILSSLSKADPKNSDYPRDLARAEHGLGVLYKDQSRFQASEQALRRAITLRSQFAEIPDALADDEQALADSSYQLGALLARQGSAKASDARIYAAALATQNKLAERYKDRKEFRARLARYRNNQGILLRALGKLDESGAILLDTIALLEPEVNGPAPTPGARWQFARACNNVAGVYRATGGSSGAAAYLKRAERTLEGLVSEFPEAAAYRYELAAVLHNSGTLVPGGSHGIPNDDVIKDFSRALALMKQLCDEAPENPSYNNRLATYQLSLNELSTDLSTAEASLRKTIDNLSALVRDYPDASEYQNTLLRGKYLLARTLLRLGQSDKSLVETDEALALGHTVLERDPDADKIRSTLVELQDLKFQVFERAKRWDEAAQAAQAMPRERPNNLESYVRAAYLLVRCAQASSNAVFEKRAVEVLSEALKHDLPLHPQHLDEAGFDSLRELPDFKALRVRVSGGSVTG
jgi:tetratricopeptide (TPR) repeat protein